MPITALLRCRLLILKCKCCQIHAAAPHMLDDMCIDPYRRGSESRALDLDRGVQGAAVAQFCSSKHLFVHTRMRDMPRATMLTSQPACASRAPWRLHERSPQLRNCRTERLGCRLQVERVRDLRNRVQHGQEALGRFRQALHGVNRLRRAAAEGLASSTTARKLAHLLREHLDVLQAKLAGGERDAAFPC